jgi:hypothetical protein
MTKNLIENRVHLVVIKSTIPDFLHLFCDRESWRSNSHGKHWNHSSVDGRKDWQSKSVWELGGHSYQSYGGEVGGQRLQSSHKNGEGLRHHSPAIEFSVDAEQHWSYIVPITS